MQKQAHDIRTNGWRDPMSVTLNQWYEFWLETYIKDNLKQSTFMSYKSYGEKHFSVLYKIIKLKKLEVRVLQEFYNYKYREQDLKPKTLRNMHMALHKCLKQAVKDRLLVTNPCDAVTLPTGETPDIAVFTTDQQRVVMQVSYRHRYGVFIRLNLCTGLRIGELLALNGKISTCRADSSPCAEPSTDWQGTKKAAMGKKQKSCLIPRKPRTPAEPSLCPAMRLRT